MTYEQLIDSLRRLRESAGFTQTELARRIGYARQSAVSNTERMENDLPASRLIDWARVCGWEVVLRPAQGERQRLANEMERALADLNEEHLALVLAMTRDLSGPDRVKRDVALRLLGAVAPSENELT